MALKKGAGGELELLKEQDLKRICVVSLGSKEEGSESFQLLSAPFQLLWSAVLGCAGVTLPAWGVRVMGTPS